MSAKYFQGVKLDGIWLHPKINFSVISSENTTSNFRVYAQRKVPAKCFKIYHILYIRKPKVAFSAFHFVLLYISSSANLKIGRSEKRCIEWFVNHHYSCIFEFKMDEINKSFRNLNLFWGILNSNMYSSAKKKEI